MHILSNWPAVVQLYIHDLVSSVTRPVKEFKGFQSVLLQPGEMKRVALELKPEHLALWNLEMHYVVEPGQFHVMTGPNLPSCAP